MRDPFEQTNSEASKTEAERTTSEKVVEQPYRGTPFFDNSDPEKPKYNKWFDPEYCSGLFRSVMEKFHHGEIQLHDATHVFADDTSVEERRRAIEGEPEQPPVAVRRRA